MTILSTAGCMRPPLFSLHVWMISLIMATTRWIASVSWADSAELVTRAGGAMVRIKTTQPGLCPHKSEQNAADEDDNENGDGDDAWTTM